MDKLGVLDNLRIAVLAEDSVLYESPYLGQHGVSFLVEGVSGRKTKRILVDVGQNSEALLYNMRIMGISPSVIDAIVLTHCHYDHTQGVAHILRETGKKRCSCDCPSEYLPSAFCHSTLSQTCGYYAR